MAALLGAHIIKVKLPTDHLEQAEAKKVYEEQKIDISTQASASRTSCSRLQRPAHRRVLGRRGQGGRSAVYDEVRAIRDGGGNGSIIGRNTFQRPREDALKMLDTIIKIYQGKD